MLMQPSAAMHFKRKIACGGNEWHTYVKRHIHVWDTSGILIDYGKDGSNDEHGIHVFYMACLCLFDDFSECTRAASSLKKASPSNDNCDTLRRTALRVRLRASSANNVYPQGFPIRRDLWRI
jgi:hypothetical protein